MDFLEKLNLLMERHNYNKNSLSKASGIPYTTIDNWYKRGYDNLQLPTVKKLCSFFDTSLDFWLKEEITNPNYGKSNGFTIDYDEMEHIKKFRFIEEHSPEGAKTVTDVIDREYVIAKRIAELESKIEELKSQDAMYTKLKPEDRSALNQGIKLLRPQSLPPAKENFREPELEELLEDEKKPASPPKDLSAFDPRDLAAVREAAKLLQPKKGHNWKNLDG